MSGRNPFDSVTVVGGPDEAAAFLADELLAKKRPEGFTYQDAEREKRLFMALLPISLDDKTRRLIDTFYSGLMETGTDPSEGFFAASVALKNACDDLWALHADKGTKMALLERMKWIEGAFGIRSAHLKTVIDARTEWISGKVKSASDPGEPTREKKKAPAKPEHEVLEHFARLRALADSKFAFDKNGRKRAGAIQNRLRRVITEALDACSSKADRVPEPIAGFVNVRKHAMHKEIREAWLTRNAGKIDEVSNLICNGYFLLQMRSKTVRVDWEMGASGELKIIIGDEAFGEDRFKGQSLVNLYLELKKVVAFGLKDFLVSQETSKKRDSFKNGGPWEDTGNGVETVPQPVINARLQSDMFVREEDGPLIDVVPQGPLVPRETQQVLGLLKKNEPITAEDAAGIRLFQKEIIDSPDGKPSIVYVPVGDLVSVLEELRTGIGPYGLDPIGKDNVFLITQYGSLRRAGYHPWTDKKNPRTLTYTQRKPSEVSEATRAHLEARTCGELALEIPDRQILRVSAGPEIDKVVIKVREGVEEAWREITLLTDEPGMIQDGFRFEDGLSEGAGLIDVVRGIRSDEVRREVNGVRETVGVEIEVILRVPQYPQYVQGAFMSLEEVERACTSA